MQWRHLAVVLPVMLAMACQGPTRPSASAAEGGVAGSGAALEIPPGTMGGGHYAVGTLDVKFSFNAVQTGNGGATGRFAHSLVLNGQLVEFEGRVTCFAVDSENRRAWIGGVVTANRSEAAAFQTEIHQPGQDVWFRVLDSGEGADAEPDRTTFLGFKGAAGIDTSEEYCQVRLWDPGNVRTNPVTEGNIQVRP